MESSCPSESLAESKGPECVWAGDFNGGFRGLLRVCGECNQQEKRETPEQAWTEATQHEVYYTQVQLDAG